MQAEAQPFIDHFGVKEVKDFFAPLPCKLYRSIISTDNGNSELNIVLNGQQHGSDLVGCEAFPCLQIDIPLDHYREYRCVSA